MTTFDGQPYIETYALSKLEIIPDFGTEHKVAPTPVCSLFFVHCFFRTVLLAQSALESRSFQLFRA